MTRVLTTGVFDHIHLGHLFLLTKAKELVGKRGKLIVLVTNDKNAKHKGIDNDQEKRAENLRKTGIPDKVVIGKEKRDYLQTIDELKPDIIVLGHDQPELPIPEEELDKWNIKVVRMQKFEDHSSTAIREKGGNSNIMEIMKGGKTNAD